VTTTALTLQVTPYHQVRHVSRTAKVLRARYENGVLKPLEPVDLRDGEEVIVFIRRRSVREVLNKYVGLFGEAGVEELKQYEEEA
jgi:predicted DNA-binding antitoxin AbrB/MazE fold protein